MNKLAYVCRDVLSQIEFRGWFLFGMNEGRLVVSVFSVLKSAVVDGTHLTLGSGITEVELFSLRASLLKALQEKVEVDWCFFTRMDIQSIYCEYMTHPIPSQKPVVHVR